MDDCLLTYYQEGRLSSLRYVIYLLLEIVDTTQEVVDHLAASFNTFVPGLGRSPFQRYIGRSSLTPKMKTRKEIYEGCYQCSSEG